MDIQSILDRISSDGEKNAAAVLCEARDKAEAMKKDLEERVRQMREKTAQRVKRDSDEARDRLFRMAELEEKKERLKVKRDVMDEAFLAARAKILAMDGESMRRFFTMLAVNSAAGSAMLCPGKEKKQNWYDEHVIDEVNRELRNAGKDAVIREGGETDGCGFVLRTDSLSVDCTVDTLIGEYRSELETEVAGILFPAEK